MVFYLFSVLAFGGVMFVGAYSNIKHELTDCGSHLRIASAYFSVDNNCLRFMMTSTHRLVPKLGEEDHDLRCSVNGTMGSFVQTIKHDSHCSLCFTDEEQILQYTKIENISLRLSSIIDNNETRNCNLNAFRLEHSPKISSYLVGVTQVRNPVRLNEWIDYHTKDLFDHIYIYNDGSSENFTAEITSKKVTVLDWSHASHLPKRQFMAMQDFIYRFARTSKWVLQFDNDCFFNSEGLRKLLNSPNATNAAQVSIASVWYGACAKPSASTSTSTCFESSLCVVEDTNVSYVCGLTGMSDHPKFYIDWGYSDGGKSRKVRGDLSLAQTNRLKRASGITHCWDVSGTTWFVPTDKYWFAHYKVLPWVEHLNKTNGGTWGSVSNRGGRRGWEKYNKDLCKIHQPYEICV